MNTYETLKKLINDSDAIVIGAGAGLSTAAGFEYGGETFLKNFPYMYQEYGYTDMYSAGFHPFDTLEEQWAYWSKMVYLLRYESGPKPLYQKLYKLFKDKNYFVITTNVDHQFQLAGFDKKRLFYMQGDYGLFQCSLPCSQVTYDNHDAIINMMNHIKNNRIPLEFVPLCPKCGRPLRMNLREDESFVEDEGWHQAEENYQKFLKEYQNKKILFLEFGVGLSTPVWIKYPFMRMTLNNASADYVIFNQEKFELPKEIKNQTIQITEDVNQVIDSLLQK